MCLFHLVSTRWSLTVRLYILRLKHGAQENTDENSPKQVHHGAPTKAELLMRVASSEGSSGASSLTMSFSSASLIDSALERSEMVRMSASWVVCASHKSLSAEKQSLRK